MRDNAARSDLRDVRNRAITDPFLFATSTAQQNSPTHMWVGARHLAFNLLGEKVIRLL